MRGKRRAGFNRRLISVAVASCFVTSTALANPAGPAVASGAAAFRQAGNLQQIANNGILFGAGAQVNAAGLGACQRLDCPK
jgi:large exoprotein involved in heme utilization and adhesion